MSIELMSMLYGLILATFGAFMFILGYNISAPMGKKIAVKKPKHEKTEAEIMLERIDKAHL